MGNTSSSSSSSDAREAEAVKAATVEKIVDGFMKNKRINSAMIPDAVERAIYENVLTLVMGVLEEVTASANVEVLGHRLEMKLVAAKPLLPPLVPAPAASPKKP